MLEVLVVHRRRRRDGHSGGRRKRERDARRDADRICVSTEQADIYPDIYQIALVGIYTNTIYQIVIWELTPNSKNAVVNGPP